MEKSKMFVIGDVHGQMSMLEEMLEHWQPAEEQLLFVGDLADRGENSKAVFERVHELMETEGAIVVKGNHDEMLEMFLENPSENLGLYYMNGGQSTVNSLLGKNTARGNYLDNVQEIKETYPWLLPMLKSLPLYYEWGDYLFVHAGVNLQLDNWRDSSDHDFVWIREGFYDQPNHTNKKIIFGHSVTSTLHGNMSNFDIWTSGDGLIGIDGGAVYGGHLHGLVLSEDETLAHYVVENDGYQF
jgi:serine/threonine protein phosphatase 1